MKTFYLNAVVRLRMNLAILLLSVIASAPLAAQDTTTTRMHEVGLQIYNFNLESFGIIYKAQKRDHANRYTRYGLTFANLNFNRDPDFKTSNYNAGLNTNFGNETRTNINSRTQFLHGLQYGASFNFSGFDDSRNRVESYNTRVGLGLGYLLGIMYSFNENFYISLETVPSLGVSNEWRTTYANGTKATSSSFNIGASFNSQAAALTFAYRFGATR